MRDCRGVILAAVMGGCIAADGGVMEITNAVRPDTTCVVAPSNPVQLTGVYDPVLDATGYYLALRLRNNAEARNDEPQVLGATNVRARVNDIVVKGFEGCWAVFQGDITKVGALNNGNVLDCSKLPGQSGSIPGSGTLEEGGQSPAVVEVPVLTPAHMQQLFGANFNPSGIPRSAQFTANGITYVPTFSEDPASPNRAAAWGTYPSARAVNVVVQLRAIGTTQTGYPVRSEYFPFLIEICPYCVLAQCSPLLQLKSCIPKCPDGSACTNGQCGTGAGATACPPGVPTESGQVVSFTAPICEPAQGFGATQCVAQGC